MRGKSSEKKKNISEGVKDGINNWTVRARLRYQTKSGFFVPPVALNTCSSFYCFIHSTIPPDAATFESLFTLHKLPTDGLRSIFSPSNSLLKNICVLASTWKWGRLNVGKYRVARKCYWFWKSFQKIPYSSVDYVFHNTRTRSNRVTIWSIQTLDCISFSIKFWNQSINSQSLP